MATKIKQASIAIRQNKGRDTSPSWDGCEEWKEERFHRHFHSAMNWYRLEKSNKDLKPKVIDWMGRNGYDKHIIKAFKNTKDSRCNLTMGAIAACLLKGMPESNPNFNNGKNTADWLRNEIAKVIEEGKEDEIQDPEVTEHEIKSNVPVVTIQDRLRETAGSMSEELDAAIDSWIIDPEKFNPKEFKVVNLLRTKGAKAAHARLIKEYFKFGYEELLELASGDADEQLREAYRHNSRKNVKKLIEFYASVMDACDQITAEAKVLKKPRAKKIKPVEQLIAKLKFCVRDEKLGIVSVPPAQLIGAQGVVVYNIKNRKIGYYTSSSPAGFNVKGTTLIDFSDKSVQKTLRKPAEQIKEAKDQNTQRRFENWFSKNVKTTEIALNGRFGEDTLILKVFK